MGNEKTSSAFSCTLPGQEIIFISFGIALRGKEIAFLSIAGKDMGKELQLHPGSLSPRAFTKGVRNFLPFISCEHNDKKLITTVRFILKRFPARLIVQAGLLRCGMTDF